VYIRRQSLLF